MENSNQEILQAIQMLATKMDEGINQLRKDMEAGFNQVNQRIDKLEKKVDSIQEEVADLKEWRTSVDLKLDHLIDIEKITKYNSYEIVKLKVKQEYQ